MNRVAFTAYPVSCQTHKSQRCRHRGQRSLPQQASSSRIHRLYSAASPSVAPWESFAQPSGLRELKEQCSRAAGCTPRRRQVTRMGNKSGKGPFTPIVIVVRNVVGKKEFNQLRGKAISLHSQVIKSFGAQIGAENKQVQGLIRLAKKNGEKLGFLS